MYKDETSGTSLKKRVMEFGILFAACASLLILLALNFLLFPLYILENKTQCPLFAWAVLIVTLDIAPLMDWWHKMRRVWLSVSARVKPRKAGGTGTGIGTGGGRRDDVSGLLKLRDDVQMCGYKDVQVMWNMLSKSQQEQKDATSSNTQPGNSSNSKCSKHRFTWRFFF